MNSLRLVILLLLLAYVFLPTLLDWVISPEGAWYRPFVVWVLVILMAFALHMRKKRHEL